MGRGLGDAVVVLPLVFGRVRVVLIRGGTADEEKREEQKRLQQEEATLNAAKNLMQYKQNKEKFEKHS